MNLNATILGQIISFAIFVWFCMNYVWPPIMKAMQERQKKVADGLQAAERAEHNLELAQEKVALQLKEAKQQAAGILDQASKRASQVIEEAKQQARVEGDRLKVAAQAEIAREAQQTKEALRAQVAALAIQGAEKILQRTIDVNAHADLLHKLATEL